MREREGERERVTVRNRSCVCDVYLSVDSFVEASSEGDHSGEASC